MVKAASKVLVAQLGQVLDLLNAASEQFSFIEENRIHVKTYKEEQGGDEEEGEKAKNKKVVEKLSKSEQKKKKMEEERELTA